MDYRMKLAKRMLFNKKGSLIGAVLAVTIGILVIHVNFVIFQGLFDAIVRDISEYRNGDILVTNEDDYIEKSDSSIVSWFERISYVECHAPTEPLPQKDWQHPATAARIAPKRHRLTRRCYPG